MKVFLSWSGERSRLVAEAMHDWLPQVIQVVEPWLSKADIEKGARWGPEISDRLEEAKIAIVCLTAENLDAPWILFEAGAIAKTKEAKLCTLLLDLTPSTVQPPLGQFQSTQFEKEDVRKLVETIVRRVRESDEKAPSSDVVTNTFDKFWPDLVTRIETAKAATPTTGAPARKTEEILDEILLSVRRLENVVAEVRPDRWRFELEDFMRSYPGDRPTGRVGHLSTLGEMTSSHMPHIRGTADTPRPLHTAAKKEE
jgi:hypothetical protein